ncbi:CSC1-like protein RXW8 isoform X1 [Dendrobium catenatum]|uniref:CSC1-like protein RXW8 isoform X1 n=1 Tax=Dendrobium catenatum TaxID=906689 RepID=UPI00109FE56D|nr:CSC1-like protein RXW8 isoform X1 [Dendrobium catenatum]
MIQLVTGYLPSVILLLFFYAVPPTMMLFSTVEGAISRSGRKKSACCKVLYFTIWNVFFVNVLSASVIHQLMFISHPKDIPFVLARTLPGQATFFITYVLTSGWTSLCAELVQCFPLTYNLLQKYVFRKKLDDPNMVPTFPYHTEVPRVLLFGLLGFTCSILAPLILPFLMVYFLLGYLIYRNQMLNVYRTKYESGGQLWPVVHNSTIFSLVLAQIIALGVFGIKKSTVASGLVVPLVIFTLLFHEYCRKRFLPIFKNFSAQVGSLLVLYNSAALVEMDREDEMSGKMEEIHLLLQSAYSQPVPKDKDEDEDDVVDGGGDGGAENSASVI